MTLGNGVRSLAVSCWQCHHQAVLSAERWPDDMPVPAFGPRNGVHALRNHRCRRPAELAGATGAAERRWHRAMAMSRDQRRALVYITSSGSQPYELRISTA